MLKKWRSQEKILREQSTVHTQITEKVVLLICYIWASRPAVCVTKTTEHLFYSVQLIFEAIFWTKNILSADKRLRILVFRLLCRYGFAEMSEIPAKISEALRRDVADVTDSGINFHSSKIYNSSRVNPAKSIICRCFEAFIQEEFNKMASRPKGFGMTAELARKVQSKMLC